MENNKKDSNDWPYDPTFINAQSGCPAAIALGEEGREFELDTLRRFVDEVLSRSPAGQEVIRLYYAWGPAVVKAMDEDEAFRNEVKAVLDDALALIADK